MQRFYKKEKKNKFFAGFTLIEVLISVSIFSMVLLGVVVLVQKLSTEGNFQIGLVSETDQARKAAFSIMRELRNAQTAATGAYGLEKAGDQEIIFYSNYDNNGLVERLRYFAQNNKLYKGIVFATGNPPQYATAGETITQVEDNLANAATPIFYYYDGSYNGVSGASLTQPVNVTQVKLVKMNLILAKKAQAQTSGTFSVTASASIRNLKNNLGN